MWVSFGRPFHLKVPKSVLVWSFSELRYKHYTWFYHWDWSVSTENMGMGRLWYFIKNKLRSLPIITWRASKKVQKTQTKVEFPMSAIYKEIVWKGMPASVVSSTNEALILQFLHDACLNKFLGKWGFLAAPMYHSLVKMRKFADYITSCNKL